MPRLLTSAGDMAGRMDQHAASNMEHGASSGGWLAASLEPSQVAAPQQRSGLVEAAVAGAGKQCADEADPASTDRLAHLLGEPPAIDLRRLRAELLRAPDVLSAYTGRAARMAPHRRNVRLAQPTMQVVKPCSAEPVQQGLAAREPEQAAARGEDDLVHSHEGTGAPASGVREAAVVQAVCGVQEADASACKGTEACPDQLDGVSAARHDAAVQPREALSRCGLLKQ